MASEIFNTLTGYSVGIPPVQVIDTTGNVVTNVNAPAANVTANTVYANFYRYANGVSFATASGGNNTQLQYNNSGAFAGIPNVTWNGNALSLGNVSTVKLAGGINGYFLQTDGSGNLTWAPAAGGNAGNGTPGGANSQVQFNEAGSFGGDAGFTYNNVTNTLSADAIISTVSNATTINATTVNATTFIGNGSQLTGIVPNNANFVIQPTQSNITSIGTLTSLNVSGNATFTSSVTLGSIANIRISGGIAGYLLSTDGTGNLSWTAPSGGSGSPGGSNAQVQFNNSGNFAGSAALTFNSTANTMNLNGNLTIKNLTANNATNYGNISASGNVKGYYIYGDGRFLTNVEVSTANTVIASSQPNITSVGTLTTLSVSNNISAGQTITAGAFQTAGNAQVGTLTANATSINGILTTYNTVNFTNSSLINLGSVSNIQMGGGINGYVLTTNGAGTLTWQPPASGNTGNAGGLTTQVQYNKNNEFAGSSFFTFNDSNNTAQIGGLLIANTFQVGSGAYKFGTSAIQFANTSTTSKTVLYSIPVTDCSGAEFDVISTNSIEQKRQFVKLASIYYAGQVQYNEYAGMSISGGIGNFEVEYNPGNVIIPPSVDLVITPNSANNIVYKMLVTILAP
jgi:hypothetical protein